MEKNLQELMTKYNYCVIEYTRKNNDEGYTGIFGYILGNKYFYVTLKDVYNTVIVFDKQNKGDLKDTISIVKNTFGIIKMDFHNKGEYVYLDEEIKSVNYIDYLNPLALRTFLLQSAENTIKKIKEEKESEKRQKKEEREKKAIEKIVKKSLPSKNFETPKKIDDKNLSKKEKKGK